MKRKKKIGIGHWVLALILVLGLAGVSLPAFGAGGTWTTLAPMLEGTAFTAGGAINGQLYVASGWTSGSDQNNFTLVQAYNPLTNSWVAKSPIPTQQATPASGVIDGKLYVVGGSAWNYYWVNMLQIYDSTTDTWTTGAQIPISNLGQASTGVIDGKLYVVGGFTMYSGNTGEGYSLPNLWVYNPATDSWTSKAPMSTPRIGPAVGVINGKLYVAGGLSGYVSGATIYNTMEVYDPATDTWTAKAPMPIGLYAGAAGVVNGILYVMGGGGYSGYLTGVYAYDPVSDTWTTCTPMPGPAYGPASGVIGGVIYVAGGNSDSGTNNSLWAFTPQINVTIDIDPWLYPNYIHRKLGIIPVAILSSPDFDASAMVDRTSLKFGRTGEENSLAYCLKSPVCINGDRRPDLLAFFYAKSSGFQCGDKKGVLTGRNKDGQAIKGTDSVKIWPCP